MAPTTIDLTEVLKAVPAGEWVALTRDLQIVVATGKSLEEALEAARNRGEEQPVVFKVPPANALIL